MKKHLSKRLFALLLVMVMILGLAMPAGAVGTTDDADVRYEKIDNDVVSSSLRGGSIAQNQAESTHYRNTDTVRVSIVLEEKSTIEKGYPIAGIALNARAMSYRDGLQARQQVLAANISAQALGGKELNVVWNLTLAANIISANVAYGEIEAIRDVKGVKDVIIENRYTPDVVSVEPADPNMATSGSMIGTGEVWDTAATMARAAGSP